MRGGKNVEQDLVAEKATCDGKTTAKTGWGVRIKTNGSSPRQLRDVDQLLGRGWRRPYEKSPAEKGSTQQTKTRDDKNDESVGDGR